MSRGRHINDFPVQEHFNLQEFECPCCHRVMLDGRFPDAFEDLRWRVNAEFRGDGPEWKIRITSGYRCDARNAMVGGVTNSRHLEGRAVDFFVYRRWADGREEQLPIVQLLRITTESGRIKRTGIYDDFIHGELEARDDLPASWHG
jgi:hypothetical protein